MPHVERRHRVDWVALVAGVVFLVVALAHVAARSNDKQLDLHWTFPLLLLVLGVLGLLSAVRTGRGDDHVEAGDGGSTAPVQPWGDVERTEDTHRVEDAQATDDTVVLGDRDQAAGTDAPADTEDTEVVDRDR